MKADIPKEERQRREREQWTEIRAALVRNHFQTVQDQMAIDAALFQMELEQFQRAAPAIYALLGRTEQVTVPVPAPVLTPEPEPVTPPVPEPLVARPGAPDVPFDLRHRLGLQ